MGIAEAPGVWDPPEGVRGLPMGVVAGARGETGPEWGSEGRPFPVPACCGGKEVA